jgi:hypothetical protein
MKQLAIFLSHTLMASMGNAQCHLRLLGDVNGDGKTDIVGLDNDSNL